MKKNTGFHNITIKKNKKALGSKVLTGASTQLLIDGKKVRGVRSVTFHVEARGVAVATIELYPKSFSIDEVGKLETTQVVNLRA